MNWGLFDKNIIKVPFQNKFLTIISFSAILHVVWAYFDTIMILLSCLNNFNQQTHLNFRSKRWLEVLFDNHIIHCHLTRGLHHFGHPFFAGKVWRNPTNKLIIIFVLRDGLKFFWTILPFDSFLYICILNELGSDPRVWFNSLLWPKEVSCLFGYIACQRKYLCHTTLPTRKLSQLTSDQDLWTT